MFRFFGIHFLHEVRFPMKQYVSKKEEEIIICFIIFFIFVYSSPPNPCRLTVHRLSSSSIQSSSVGPIHSDSIPCPCCHCDNYYKQHHRAKTLNSKLLKTLLENKAKHICHKHTQTIKITHKSILKIEHPMNDCYADAFDHSLLLV